MALWHQLHTEDDQLGASGGAACGPRAGSKQVAACFLYFSIPNLHGDEMKSNAQHQKDAVATDQKFRVDDEHIREADKRHLKESEEHPNLIPKKGGKPKVDQDDGD